MNEFYLSLIIVVIFFIAMYAWAYGMTNYGGILAERRKKRLKKAAEARETKVKAEINERLAKLNEKYRATRDRSAQIQKELAELKKWNMEHLKVKE